MRRKFTTAFAALGIAGAVLLPPAVAQERNDTVRLADIVVTPTRLPTPVTAQAAVVTVLRGEDLRARGIRFVSDALLDVPGAAVVQGGSYGAVTSLFLRGGESDYVKVLLDGVPVNQPGGSFNFANLTTDNVDRIEIVQGPVSVVYGSDAVTGVIQIFTRRGAGTPAIQGRLQGGTDDARTAEGTLLGGGGNVSYSVDVSRFATDGIYRFNSQYGNTSASALVRAALDERTDVALAARSVDATSHFPTDGGGVPADSNQSTSEHGLSLSADFGHRLTDRLEVRALLTSYSSENGAQNRSDSPGDTLGFAFSSDQLSNVLRRSVDLRTNYRTAATGTLTAGVTWDADRDREFSQTVSNFGGGQDTTASPPFEATRHNAGYYLQAALTPTPRVGMTLGARLDDNQAFGTFFTYRAGALYRLTASTRVRASVGSAFKAPTFAENFARTPFEVGDPDLSPEHSTSWEAGVEQELAGGRLVLGATWFDQDFRDLIQYNFVSETVPSYYNVGRATARGVEGTARFRPSPGATIEGHYTWLDTEVTDAGFNSGAGAVFVEGQPLIRRPKHSAQLIGRAQLRSRATLGADLTYVGKRDDRDFRVFPALPVTLAAYTTLNLTADVDMIRPGAGRLSAAATIRLENAFDTRYQPVVGFRGRGRAVFVGGRFSL